MSCFLLNAGTGANSIYGFMSSAVTISVQPSGQWGEKVTQAKVSMVLNLF